MNRCLKLLCLVSFLSAGTVFGQEDPSLAIANALRNGNSKEISKYFNDMVDLNIPGFKDNYSKTQAERILQDFFTKNQVKAFSLSRQGTSSDGSKFNIGTLDAGNKKFRVFFLFRKTNGVYLILQFQIQQE